MIKDKLKRRHLRIRKRIIGSTEKPRLCVKRSSKHIYAILVDDVKNKVIATISSLNKDLPGKPSVMRSAIERSETTTEEKGKGKLTGKSAKAFEVGHLLAQKAKSLGISQVIFDRAGYRYHGRVKAVAEGARKGGLKF